MSRTFAGDGTPCRCPEPPRRRPTDLALPALAVGLALLGIWMLGQTFFATNGSAVTGTAPSNAAASSAPSSASTFPPELMPLVGAMATWYAPTAEPTPTYAALPTPRPLVCGRDSRVGELCEWPRPTPVATPGPPVCVTPVQYETCLWQGSQGGRADEH